MTSANTYDCITESAIKNFKPTYLYIKRHSVTGLMYFGKTTRNYTSLMKYSGSGTYWKNHIKKYGKDDIETIWCEKFTDIYDLVDFSLLFSELFSISDSDIWANQMDENGLGGSTLGRKLSVVTKERIRQAHTGKKRPPEVGQKISESKVGKPRSAETKEKISKYRTGVKLGPYSESHRLAISEGQKGRKHSDETKQKIAEKARGRKASEETKRKMSESHKSKSSGKS